MLKLAGSKNLKIYTREVFLEKNAFDEVTDEVVQTKKLKKLLKEKILEE